MTANMTALLLIVLIVVFLIVLAYLKRVKLEDLIVIYWDLVETDPETRPGQVFGYTCPTCGEKSLTVDSLGYIVCTETLNCDDLLKEKYADEIVSLVSLFYDLSQAFTKLTRDNGDEIVKLKDGSPSWMTDAIHTAHGSTPPDDTIYAFCERVANDLGYADPDANSDDLQEKLYEIEPDIYTGDLTAWLNARPDHAAYLGEVQENFGPIEDGYQLLGLAQKQQIDEIGHSLIESLEETRDEIVSELEDLADDLSQDVLDAEEEE